MSATNDALRLTIIYDNEAAVGSLEADWGFACVITGARIPTILFDTGANGNILMSNMQQLGIDPASIDAVFLSHHHLDHTGGLSHFLNANRDVDVYVPVSLRGIRGVRELIRIRDAQLLTNHLYSTGELAGIEHSLVIGMTSGLLVVTGCSHPPMRDILTAAGQFGTVYGIIGGFHGFREFDLFRDLQLICPAHCTRYASEIRERYPDTTIPAGTGRVITLEQP
ncbi:MAG TPA: MBL fold metallo-hydrolase [bacterium]|nr:MBL fold metallo-hydrolase [bacterium]